MRELLLVLVLGAVVLCGGMYTAGYFFTLGALDATSHQEQGE